MKFSINPKTFSTELAFMQGIVEKKSTIPVLSNILIEAISETELQITGTDLDVTITTTCAANVLEAGEIVVSAHKLFDIVKALPSGEEAIFTTDSALMRGERTELVKIVSGKSSFKVPVAFREQFPEVPSTQLRGEKISIPAKVLRRFISHTRYAITNEQSRFALSGAKFEIRDVTARMVTTDGHRLAFIEKELDLPSGNRNTDAMIPRKALNQVYKLVESDDDTAIFFGEDPNHLYFTAGHRQLATRKLNGNFPNYTMVIPKGHTQAVSFDAGELLDAINRVSQMADDRTQSVTLNVRKNEIQITAQCAEEGSAEETIAALYEGIETKIKFQYEYVKDFINSIKEDDSKEISMSFNDDQGQTLFRFKEASAGFLAVIMPLRH